MKFKRDILPIATLFFKIATTIFYKAIYLHNNTTKVSATVATEYFVQNRVPKGEKGTSDNSLGNS